MPKAEIHVHLEGATAPEAPYAIARRNDIDVYRSTVDTIRTSDDLALMVAQFYVDRARRNVRYSECFISMSLHAQFRRPRDVQHDPGGAIRAARGARLQ